MEFFETTERELQESLDHSPVINNIRELLLSEDPNKWGVIMALEAYMHSLEELKEETKKINSRHSFLNQTLEKYEMFPKRVVILRELMRRKNK